MRDAKHHSQVPQWMEGILDGRTSPDLCNPSNEMYVYVNDTVHNKLDGTGNNAPLTIQEWTVFSEQAMLHASGSAIESLFTTVLREHSLPVVYFSYNKVHVELFTMAI